MSRRIVRFGSERAVRLFLRSTPSVRAGSVQGWCARDGMSRLAIIVPAKIAPRAVDRARLRRVVWTAVQGMREEGLQTASLSIRIVSSSESLPKDLQALFQSFL